jgi:regulator of Ty1 transposition protein 103
MAYSDDAVKAKLAALSETQDSIVTVAQWIMFHRYADCVNTCHQHLY